MKIIDLLNKIANGEEVPKKIKYSYYEYEFNEKEKEYQRCFNELNYGLGEDRRLDIILDEPVEILEEPKGIPEKLPIYDCIDAYSKFDVNDNRKTINEIIDYLESKGDE